MKTYSVKQYDEHGNFQIVAKTHHKLEAANLGRIHLEIVLKEMESNPKILRTITIHDELGKDVWKECMALLS